MTCSVGIGVGRARVPAVRIAAEGQECDLGVGAQKCYEKAGMGNG